MKYLLALTPWERGVLTLALGQHLESEKSTRWPSETPADRAQRLLAIQHLIDKLMRKELAS
jgi:hypothetical protein